jgi:cytidylate kinase
MNKPSHGWAGATLEARISAHVHSWEKAKDRGVPVPPETYPFITISREYGCEASLLAHQLQVILNERCRPTFPWVAYDQQLVDQVANELHLSRSVVESIDGHRRAEMTEFFDTILTKRVTEAVVIHKVAEVVRSLAIRGHSIMVGRGSYLITQDLKNGLHIRLVAPRAWRIQRIAVDRHLSLDEATRVVDQGEQERLNFLNTFFSHDAANHFLHDIIIDNSQFNLAQLSEIVFTALGARFGETLISA